MIYFFNPDNDVALAADPRIRFTPPAAALELRHSGALLPMWWAGSGDEVLVESEAAVRGAEKLRSDYGLAATAVMSASAGSVASPWGWSPTSARILREAGACGVPSDADIAWIREISHRRTSIALSEAMGAPENIIAVECFTEHDALKAIEERGGDAVIKQPWSSSGRGVMATAGMSRAKLLAAIKGTLRRQGSVMVEPRLKREADFAALFFSDGAEVKFRGASFFATDSGGAYSGNIVDSQERISDLIPVDISKAVSGAEQYLTREVAQHYSGWMGIDMLAYREDGRLLLDPCVELNLRMTMGVAAMLLNEKGLRGVLNVKPSPAAPADLDLSPVGNSRFAVVVSPF